SFQGDGVVEPQGLVVRVEDRMTEDLECPGAARQVVGEARLGVDDVPGLARQVGVVGEADERDVGVARDGLLPELLVPTEERAVYGPLRATHRGPRAVSTASWA